MRWQSWSTGRCSVAGYCGVALQAGRALGAGEEVECRSGPEVAKTNFQHLWYL